MSIQAHKNVKKTISVTVLFAQYSVKEIKETRSVIHGKCPSCAFGQMCNSKKFELMLTRHTKAYSSSGSVV